jgi:Zn-dependent protease
MEDKYCYTIPMLPNVPFNDILIVLISLLISLGIHEATHAFVAHRLGDSTAEEEGRLTLNPLKHIDLYTTILLPLALMLVGLPPILMAKPVPFNPERVRFGEYGAALIAIAGPFSNLALAALAALAINFGLVSGAAVNLVVTFMQVNISLFVFNMLPIPPLDGSRLLYAFAPEPVQRVMRQIEAMGFLVILLVVLLLAQFISPTLIAINNSILQFLLSPSLNAGL